MIVKYFIEIRDQWDPNLKIKRFLSQSPSLDRKPNVLQNSDPILHFASGQSASPGLKLHHMKCLCLRTQLSKNKKGPGPSHTNEISLFLSNRKTFYVDHFYFYNFNYVCACVIYLFIVGPELGKRRRVAIGWRPSLNIAILLDTHWQGIP